MRDSKFLRLYLFAITYSVYFEGAQADETLVVPNVLPTPRPFQVQGFGGGVIEITSIASASGTTRFVLVENFNGIYTNTHIVEVGNSTYFDAVYGIHNIREATQIFSCTFLDPLVATCTSTWEQPNYSPSMNGKFPIATLTVDTTGRLLDPSTAPADPFGVDASIEGASEGNDAPLPTTAKVPDTITQSSSRSRAGVIIGASIGGVIGLILLILIVVLKIRADRIKKQKNRPEISPIGGMNSKSDISESTLSAGNNIILINTSKLGTQ